MTLLEELARMGIHLAQDGPWNSVLIVLTPLSECVQAVTDY